MKADLKMVCLMVKAFIFGQMERGIRVNLHQVSGMVRDF
jgi:hypothetical protein